MPPTTFYTYADSPLGRLYLQSDGQFLTGLYMPQHKHWSGPDPAHQQSDKPFATVRKQLDEYFAGLRQQFDIPTKSAGTPFQLRVWDELTRIPFGVTITYGQLASRLGMPTGSRAVGNANGKNPISIIVPCHRVIGASGTLTGYAGGVEKKLRLLTLERQFMLALG
jgi:methylated-DNA-[protein]-cysteine S-methyltransferase